MPLVPNGGNETITSLAVDLEGTVTVVRWIFAPKHPDFQNVLGLRIASEIHSSSGRGNERFTICVPKTNAARIEPAERWELTGAKRMLKSKYLWAA